MTVPQVPHFWRSSLDPERVMDVQVTHWQDNQQHQREDHLTVEEPLVIRLNQHSLAVIMRTPGVDQELPLGFLLTDVLIQTLVPIVSIQVGIDADGITLAHVVDEALRPASADLPDASN